MDPPAWSDSLATHIALWISAFTKPMLLKLLPDPESDDETIQFLDSGTFFFLIQMLKVDDIWPMDLDELRANLDILKSNKCWPLISTEVSYLVRQVKGDDKPRAVYDTTVALLNTIASIALQSTPSTPVNLTPTKGTSSANSSTSLAKQLQNHWSSPLFGNSLDTLLNKLKEYETDFQKGEHYSRALVFVQSSGTGKSRLAEALGEICPVVSYIIRDEEGGFPPCDKEIHKFLHTRPTTAQLQEISPKKDVTGRYESPVERQDNIWAHALMIGLLTATFREYKESITKAKKIDALPVLATFEDLAKFFHAKALPVRGRRSSERIMFCESVVQRARIITNCCAGNKDFRECFDDISPSKVRDALTYYNPSPMADLFHAIRELKELISSFEKRPEDIPLLVVVLDEVASLLKD